MTTIQGNKNFLRDWLITDLKEYEFWRQPGHKWQEFDGPYYPSLNKQQISDKINILRNNVLNFSFPNPRENLVIADINNNKLIGQVSWYWQGKETNWISIGISIFNSDYWKKGIGYEALGLWNEYLFQEFPSIIRLDLRTWSGNKGMISLAEKLGYTKEACFRKARIVNGKYYDSLGYGILKEEWHEKYPNGFSKYLNKLEV